MKKGRKEEERPGEGRGRQRKIREGEDLRKGRGKKDKGGEESRTYNSPIPYSRAAAWLP